MDAFRRARLDLLTGGFDASVDGSCSHRARGSHAGASKRRCAQVRAYAYTSPNLSLCERLFLDRWWSLGVEAFPTWLAPNAMTALGLCCVVAAYVMMWTMSPALEFEASRWVYVACAGLAFSYQMLDGMDGKQARRTKSGSPLGEVIDHACDGFAICFYPLVVIDIFGVGHATSRARVACVSTMMLGRALFVVDTVSSTFSGVLPVSKFLDSQDVQLIVQTLMLVAATIGNRFLFDVTLSLPYVGAQTVGRVGAVFCITVGTIARVGTFIKTILASDKHDPPHWPSYRSPFKIAARCALVEAFHGLCLYKSQNFAFAHATSSILFGESEIRIMSIRVSDPDFPVTNWFALFIMACTTVVPAGDAFTSGVLIGTALFVFLHRFSSLAAQITGCLGMHPNIFIIRPRE